MDQILYVTSKTRASLCFTITIRNLIETLVFLRYTSLTFDWHVRNMSHFVLLFPDIACVGNNSRWIARITREVHGCYTMYCYQIRMKFTKMDYLLRIHNVFIEASVSVAVIASIMACMVSFIFFEIVFFFLTGTIIYLLYKNMLIFDLIKIHFSGRFHVFRVCSL